MQRCMIKIRCFTAVSNIQTVCKTICTMDLQLK